MEMTSTQRLILANQYKLMGLLDPANKAKYEEECRIVLDTLEMYHALQVSYNNLHDKSGLTQHRLQFAGYCAAREKKYLNYLRFITSVEGKYKEFMHCEHGCDSQTPMWDKYLKMLEAWRACPHEYHLSMAELQKILNA